MDDMYMDSLKIEDKYDYDVINYEGLPNFKHENDDILNYKMSLNYSNIDNNIYNDGMIPDNIYNKGYISHVNYNPKDLPPLAYNNKGLMDEEICNIDSICSTSAGINTNGTINTSHSVHSNPNVIDDEYINYFQPYPYYLNYPNIFPISNADGSFTSNSNDPNLMNAGMIHNPIQPIQLQGQVKSQQDIGLDSKLVERNLNKDKDKYTNSTIDNESIEDIEDKDGTKPPPNRSDPIYTAISGLKWKSKSKKWVVRWDNPITNRRVYKYFSGTRYGFMGAHKRAKYYLEFLNASVGKITNTTPGNPFCRRTEGPPKGKTNKSLIRKYINNNNLNNFYYPNVGNFNLPQFNGHDEMVDEKVGSTMENPWYINKNQNFNNF